MVARTTAGVKKLVLVYWLGPVRLLAEAKGASNGREVNKLWERFSVVNSGRAKRFSGRVVRLL